MNSVPKYQWCLSQINCLARKLFEFRQLANMLHDICWVKIELIGIQTMFYYIFIQE